MKNIVQDRCNQKYDGASRMKMAVTVRRKRLRLGIAALLRNTMAIMTDWSHAVLSALLVLHRPQDSFVSILESRSTDLTPILLNNLRKKLDRHGIPNVIRTRLDAGPTFVLKGSVNRIEFLARLRNLVMAPILQHMQRSRLDRVVFLNDVVLCAGDIIRLSLHDADMSCGYDFQHSVGRRIFYDSWVMDYGEFTDPSHHKACVLNDSYPLWAPCSRLQETPLPVTCCWNGAVAIRPEVFASGVRFRRGDPSLGDSDCSQSECSLLCLDMWKRGFQRILVDPNVQVGYNRGAFLYSARKRTFAPAVPPPVRFGPNRSTLRWRCCELKEVGKTDVDFQQCRMQNIPLRLSGMDA